jgi:hypothetical protein
LPQQTDDFSFLGKKNLHKVSSQLFNTNEAELLDALRDLIYPLALLLKHMIVVDGDEAPENVKHEFDDQRYYFTNFLVKREELLWNLEYDVPNIHQNKQEASVDWLKSIGLESKAEEKQLLLGNRHT